MSDHITEWLNAYHDGELKGKRLQHVEEHLAGCQTCQTEFESLQGLSGLLHEVPVPEFISNERFIAQVNLQIPRQTVALSRRKVLEVGWWTIPVGLLMVWIFFNTAIFLSDIMSAANNFGLLDSGITAWVTNSASDSYWTSALGQLGILKGSSLQWAESTESYTRNVLPQFIWQASIAMLYLTWIAIWWARHTLYQHQQHGRPTSRSNRESL